jgi:hypothetical protein
LVSPLHANSFFLTTCCPTAEVDLTMLPGAMSSPCHECLWDMNMLTSTEERHRRNSGCSNVRLFLYPLLYAILISLLHLDDYGYLPFPPHHSTATTRIPSRYLHRRRDNEGVTTPRRLTPPLAQSPTSPPYPVMPNLDAKRGSLLSGGQLAGSQNVQISSAQRATRGTG